MRVLIVIAGLLACVAVVNAQQQSKPRVFVKESVSSELWGGGVGRLLGRIRRTNTQWCPAADRRNHQNVW